MNAEPLAAGDQVRLSATLPRCGPPPNPPKHIATADRPASRTRCHWCSRPLLSYLDHPEWRYCGHCDRRPDQQEDPA